MPSRRMLDLIEAYMKANAAYQWEKAQQIFEEYKAEERREEKEKKEKRDKEEDA